MEMIPRLTFLLAILLVLSFSVQGHAKCSVLIITIEVEVLGQVKPDQSVTVDVAPQASWSFLLAGSSPNRFFIQIPFSTVSGRGFFEERCNRKPRTITVTLRRWMQRVDAIELKYPDDFVEDRTGNHPREKVVLDVDHVGPPWIRKAGNAASGSPR